MTKRSGPPAWRDTPIRRLQTTFLLLLALWLLLTTSLVYAATAGNKALRAIIGMGLGLIVLWGLRFDAKIASSADIFAPPSGLKLLFGP